MTRLIRFLALLPLLFSAALANAEETGKSIAERIDETARDGVVAFTPASSVILQFASRPPDGWSAVVESREPLAAPAHCGIFRGPPSAAPHRALTHPGEVVCW